MIFYPNLKKIEDRSDGRVMLILIAFLLSAIEGERRNKMAADELDRGWKA